MKKSGEKNNKKSPSSEKKSGEKKSEKNNEPEPVPTQTQSSGAQFNTEEQPSSSNQEPVVEIVSTPKSVQSIHTVGSQAPDFSYEDEEAQRESEEYRRSFPKLPALECAILKVLTRVQRCVKIIHNAEHD